MDKEDNGITKGNSRIAFFSMGLDKRNENKRMCVHAFKRKIVHADIYTNHRHPFLYFKRVSRPTRQDLTQAPTMSAILQAALVGRDQIL